MMNMSAVEIKKNRVLHRHIIGERNIRDCITKIRNK